VRTSDYIIIITKLTKFKTRWERKKHKPLKISQRTSKIWVTKPSKQENMAKLLSTTLKQSRWPRKTQITFIFPTELIARLKWEIFKEASRTVIPRSNLSPHLLNHTSEKPELNISCWSLQTLSKPWKLDKDWMQTTKIWKSSSNGWASRSRLIRHFQRTTLRERKVATCLSGWGREAGSPPSSDWDSMSQHREVSTPLAILKQVTPFSPWQGTSSYQSTNAPTLVQLASRCSQQACMMIPASFTKE